MAVVSTRTEELELHLVLDENEAYSYR